MIYTPMTKKAIKLLFEKQKEQQDKAGLPYVFHPFHVAEQMEEEVTVTVALLHDLIEDTEVTFQNLSEMGFSQEVIGALEALTKGKKEDYCSYIKRLSENSIARKVKIKDLEHNMDLTRLSTVTEKDLKRVEKYKKSYQYLIEIHKNSEKMI
jgi:(p)ppGpp synthase/HD superfamily hydrolase